MSDDYEALGQRLRVAREVAEMTQTYVAETLGLHRPALSLIESGKQKVPALLLVRLARLYGRPLAWFLEET